jgi:hypothetical protein
MGQLFRIIAIVIVLALLATLAFGQSAYEVIDYSSVEGEPFPWDLPDPANTALPQQDLPLVQQNNPVPSEPVSLPVSALKRTPSAVEAPASASDSTPKPQQQPATLPAVEEEEFFFPSEVEQEALFHPEEVAQTTQEIINAPQSISELGRYGILSAGTGGFPRDFWAGLEAPRAKALLDRLAITRLQSHAAERLLYRALMSEAVEPKGLEGPEWLALRAETLLGLGHADAARILLAPVPESALPQNIALAKVWSSSNLLADKAEEACPFIKNMVRNSDDVYWRRALITCQILLENPDAVRLSLELTPLEDQAEAPFFFMLAAAIQGKGNAPAVEEGDVIDPLSAILFVHKEELLSPSVIPHLPDTLLRRLVVDETLLPSLRLQAAEHLVNTFGEGEDVALLAELYRAVNVSKEGEDPLSLAEKEADGGLARAMLFQLVDMGEREAGVRALALTNFWHRAEEDGLQELVHAITPSFVDLPASATQVWLAPTAIRGALLTGDAQTAKAWWQVLRTAASPSAELARARDKFQLAFALLDGSLTARELDGWWPVQNVATAQRLPELVRRVSVLEGAGVTMDESLWQGLQTQLNDAYVELGRGPGSLWLRQVARELEAEHMGAVLLTILQPLRYAAPEDLPTTGVANILMALRYMGLKADAQAIALEALLTAE